MTSVDDCLIPLGDVPAGPTRAHRVLAAIEPSIELPAWVRRDEEPVGVSLSEVERELRQVIARFGGLTVDVETSGYPVGHPNYQLRTVQLGDDQVAVVFDAADLRQARSASELLAAAPRLYAHCATADLVPLAYAGLIDYESGWERMRDTVIPAKLANPASTGSGPGLKQLAETMLGSEAVTTSAEADRAALFTTGGWLSDTKPTTPVARSGWAQVDPLVADHGALRRR